MMGRRSFLAAGTALALTVNARAQASRLSFMGSQEQGGLVIGRAPAGTRITLDEKPNLVSPEGVFAFGLPFDASKPVHVTAIYPDGVTEVQSVLARVRQYELQPINGLPEKYVEPPPEVAERMAHERELIWKARTRETEGTDFINPLEWPFAGRLSGRYGSQRVLNGKPMAPHLGVDIAAPEGTPIHAAADGIVSISGEYYLEGGFTMLDLGHGVATCYLHQSKRLVEVGQKVKRGEVIGHVGMTGRATGPHTHWSLSWFQVKLDPSRSTRTPEPPAA